MAGIEFASIETINKFSILSQSLNHQAEFGTIENIEHFVKAGVNGLAQEIRFQQRFNLQCNITKDHGEVERL